MPQKNEILFRRARYSLKGFATAWKGERAFRQQMTFTAAALLIVALIAPAPAWWAIIVLALSGAAAMELMNAAVEAVCDRMHPELHPLIGAAKDLASAAVFAMNTAVTVVIALLVVSEF